MFIVFGLSQQVDAQIIKEFTVEKKHGFNLVQLDFSSYKGVSDIGKRYITSPIHIHGHLSKVNILPDFQYSIDNNVLKVVLNHQNVENENLGKSLSSKIFSNKQANFDHTWDVGLCEKFTYDLNFNFEIGKANLDLSELNVKKCKIKTVTADVDLNYKGHEHNPSEMDTMMVKVNMGTVNAVNIGHANASQVIFDVNYGKVNLNFPDPVSIKKSCRIATTVGAGAVYVVLPPTQYSYRVKIKSTAMCRTSLPGHLVEKGNKTYVSKGYRENAENLLTFEFDVSVGSLVLK
ncbi:hypothetical protein QWY93_04330 [Echinicola jeungdonensis]|uniref:hypothetical protein n=1 Tax=Echinicola jeungdonensis TaxID=709343 RepID=UPI0025B54FFE|nr:hypothetical protein [Echinicola jeungdonensis]MDN3668549.1 hypothetical protein [Echinicola jeungdonensis]